MKAKYLKELRNLLESDEFKEWWSKYNEKKVEISHLESSIDEMMANENLHTFRANLIQKRALDRIEDSSQMEALAAKWLAEASDMDNKSYEAVAKFESKRVEVSELWFRVGALDHEVEVLKQDIETLRKRLESASDRQEVMNLRTALKSKEQALESVSKEFAKVSEQYEREAARKKKLWEDVEMIWGISIEYNLKVAEAQMKAKKFKREAEQLLKESNYDSKRASDIRAEIEQKKSEKEQAEKYVQELLRLARERFDCIAEDEFLYWQQKENSQFIYCVPLITDLDNYNIEIRALNVYQVDRSKGVTFIEPLPGEKRIREEEDTRLDDFFTKGRKGINQQG
jgi:chromosome segregation ATPase